jgi:hypothetical protein
MSTFVIVCLSVSGVFLAVAILWLLPMVLLNFKAASWYRNPANDHASVPGWIRLAERINPFL